MARKHQTRVTTFLVYLVFSHLTKKTGWAQTWSKVWRHIAWSLQAILRGLWPDRSPEGLAWPPGSLEEKVAGTPDIGGPWWLVEETLNGCRNTIIFRAPPAEIHATCASAQTLAKMQFLGQIAIWQLHGFQLPGKMRSGCAGEERKERWCIHVWTLQ